MSEKTCRYIVLTGAPGLFMFFTNNTKFESDIKCALSRVAGSGKTTLVKKVCSILKQKNIALNGFFTEEVRSGRERTGFDVVLMNGEHAPLARVKSESCKDPCVGKYAVQVKSFESCVLPLLSSYDKNAVLVLDEIGKMELLSQKFKETVVKCINDRNVVILATVPLKSAKPIPIVEMVKSHPESALVTVDKENRSILVDKVTSLIIEAKKQNSATSI